MLSLLFKNLVFLSNVYPFTFTSEFFPNLYLCERSIIAWANSLMLSGSLTTISKKSFKEILSF